MLDNDTKRRIDTARDILVGKVPDPKSQVEQITLALIYKFMDDMDLQSVGFGGIRSFFTGDYERYAWSRLFDASLGGFEMLNLYSEGLTKMSENPNLPLLFRNIFRNAYLPFRDAETLRLFLKTIHEFTYDHSERLGDAFEYLLSVLGSQGDAGQFRTPRHIIDFIVQVVAPQKHETVLDPACGTAGFLISAYKYILAQNTTIDPKTKRPTDHLTIDEKNRLVQNFTGYDVSPDMVRLSQVNLYLHQFPDPKIFEYDTLSDEDRWNDTFDVILANPPFMTPKGFKSLNRRYRIQANRAEVLFVDYIAEHIHPVTGRAAIIVPEGIIFQSANVYQALRRMLVQEGYLWAVASLPAGVFQPYSGVKTSVLFLDRAVAKKSGHIHFVKIAADGFGLGAQRRAEEKNDLPAALDYLTRTREAILTGQPTPETADVDVLAVEKTAFGEDFNLSMDRYREGKATGKGKWEMVLLAEVFSEIKNGKNVEQIDEVGKYRVTRIQTIAHGIVDLEKTKWTNDDVSEKDFLFPGDILLSHINSIEHLAKTAIFCKSTEKVVHGINLLRLRPIREIIIPEFAIEVLKSEPFVSKAKSFAQKAVNQASLKTSDVREFQIPLPPLSHQKALVAQIEQWQKVADGARQIVQHYKPHIEVGEDWERVKLGEVCEKITKGCLVLK